VTEADELHASRARLADSAASERRRIERALHDGVQQDLIAISVRLQLLRELLGDDATPALELLAELQRDTRDALDRIRALASDTYPSILDARGLPDALREAARASGRTVRVVASSVGRHPAELERAVYFCCRALLETAAPEAEPTLVLRESDRELQVEAAGDFDVTAARDLAEAAGGKLTVDRDQVTATFPLGYDPSAR
jgi:hypothetical protein